MPSIPEVTPSFRATGAARQYRGGDFEVKFLNLGNQWVAISTREIFTSSRGGNREPSRKRHGPAGAE